MWSITSRCMWSQEHLERVKKQIYPRNPIVNSRTYRIFCLVALEQRCYVYIYHLIHLIHRFIPLWNTGWIVGPTHPHPWSRPQVGFGVARGPSFWRVEASGGKDIAAFCGLYETICICIIYMHTVYVCICIYLVANMCVYIIWYTGLDIS